MSGEQWGEAVERELVQRCVGEMDLDCAWDDWRTQSIRDAIKAAHAAGVADTRRKVAEELLATCVQVTWPDGRTSLKLAEVMDAAREHYAAIARGSGNGDSDTSKPTGSRPI